MNPIPKVRDDDPEDVSWALSTAATQYARGDRAEALKWLRRAAEAASEAEHDTRALELAKAAADLSVPPPAMTPKAPPAQAKAAPKQPPPPKHPPPPAKRQGSKSKADDTSKRPAMRSKPSVGETQRLRAPSTADERTDTNIVTEVTKLDPTPVAAAEADAWPTESMGQSDLESLDEVYGQERTRIGALAYKPEANRDMPAFRASQAVPVVVWRGADGGLRVAPKGTAVSAVTIDALLVAPGPDVDLLAWLSPA